MNICIFYDSTNTWIKTILRNASGWFKKDGNEFANMAAKYMEWHNGRGDSVISFDVSEGGDNKTAMQKRHFVYSVLNSLNSGNEKFDRVTFFMHGHNYGLNRRMISRVNTVKFAQKLYRVTNDNAKIILYSCKTGNKKGNGFAAQIANMTLRKVMGHTTSGHTVWNPYKRVFGANGLDSKDLWPRGWIKRKKYMRELRYNPEKCFELVEGALNASQ